MGNGTLRLIWQFPNWRMDIDTQEGKAVFINVNNKSYLCSDEGGQGQCLTVDSGADAALPFLSTFTDPDELQDFINTTASLDVKKSDRKIAGQNARCFS
ncbi:MAG TPA: hypothetical protein VNL15_07485, partial [Dehalococcoidia bacterium]|nr:hypothetical protein [Dehalococcoidia bacterium]